LSDTSFVPFTGQNGLHGILDTTQILDGSQDYVHVMLDNQRDVLVPANLLQRRPDGSYYLAHDLSMQDAQSESNTIRVPVIAEQFDVEKQEVIKGTVRISKRVHEQEETVDEPGFVEDVIVERVPVNRPVDGPVGQRQEGDTLIIPLLEEVLVVEKRLVLREEVRITKRRRNVHQPHQGKLRREEVTVNRIDGGPDEGESLL